MEESDSHKSVIVVGNGWAALGAVGYLVSGDRPVDQVIWIQGSGARLLPPVPAIESGAGASAWKELAARLDVEVDGGREGVFLREYRNKAFRPPAWLQDPEEIEALWAPERLWVAMQECRFDKDLYQLEREIREKIMTSPRVKVIAGLAISRMELDAEPAVTLASGEKVIASSLIYADRWADLRKIEGAPRHLDAGASGKVVQMLDLGSAYHPCGAVQLVLTHGEPMGESARCAQEGFFVKPTQDANELHERYVWGYFSSDGRQSVWTIFLAPDEVEDNHVITKKIRRIKQALNKMFSTAEWLPSSVVAEGKDFLSTVVDESVHFEEGVIYSKGHAISKSVRWDSKPVRFLTDGFGPARAFEQARDSVATPV